MPASLESHPYRLPAQTTSSQANADLYQSSNSRAGSYTHSRSDAALAGSGPLAQRLESCQPTGARVAAISLQPPVDSLASPILVSPSGTSLPQPTKVSHQGSELFDAIVQAADPRHPDHAAWQERYGSLSNRSSRASFSSGHKRDKLASSSQAATPLSRKSFDQSDLPARRRLAARKAGNWDLSHRYPSELGGSDADDPLVPAVQSGDDRTTPVRASFDGSVRSHRSSSVASSSHRRRARRLRDKSHPKPLVPPIPPPRVTSSTNWQSTFGSPSLPELATSTPRTPGHPSSSGNTSDNHDHTQLAMHAHRLHASPSAPGRPSPASSR